jgi:hypothetical protein
VSAPRRKQKPMIRISMPYLYSLAEALEPLGSIQEKAKDGAKFGDVFFPLWNAHTQLETLISASVFAGSLRSCLPTAANLIRELAAVLARHTQDFDSTVEPHELVMIQHHSGQFRIAFLAELATLPSYFVTQKGSHDTLTLLDNPSRIFPATLANKVPEAMFDVAAAGTALAYDMPTSCGFHAFRATEAVLRRYYTEVTGGQPQPKARNIAVYVNAMRQRKCGDERILSVISQLSSLHRNPLIHPEVVLTADEALAILGMAHSAVTVMLTALPTPPPTTANVAAQPLEGPAS